jgi:hypothetical protein
MNIFIFTWLSQNWEILIASLILVFIAKQAISFNKSFDKDPEFSTEEKIKTFVNGTIIFFSLSLVFSLIISYYI